MNLKSCEKGFSFLSSFPSHSRSCSYFALTTHKDSIRGYSWFKNLILCFVVNMKIVYKMFTEMLDVDVLLEYLFPLNGCYIHFYNAHKCKRVNLKYVLFNVTRLHKSSRPILDSVSHWNPVSAMEGNQAFRMAKALLLQVLADVPGSFPS